VKKSDEERMGARGHHGGGYGFISISGARIGASGAGDGRIAADGSPEARLRPVADFVGFAQAVFRVGHELEVIRAG